jgi:hypothetical protein
MKYRIYYLEEVIRKHIPVLPTSVKNKCVAMLTIDF